MLKNCIILLLTGKYLTTPAFCNESEPLLKQDFNFQSPEIQCTILDIYKKVFLFKSKLPLKKYDSISNDSVRSKLTISNKKINLMPKLKKKTNDFEKIEISKDDQKLILKIYGKPISRKGTLELNGEKIAKITCH